MWTKILTHWLLNNIELEYDIHHNNVLFRLMAFSLENDKRWILSIKIEKDTKSIKIRQALSKLVYK